MQKIRFYKIDLEYIKYLWKHDNRVQYSAYESEFYNERRPYIGIILTINELQYFAPLEHPRKSHKTLKNNPHILKINNGKHGLIAFNNMIPVNNRELIEFDFRYEDIRYQGILRSQFIFCDNNKNNINQYAKDTYDKVVNKKIPFFVNISCNFKLLEEKCLEYPTYLESIKEVAAAIDENIHIDLEDQEELDL